MSEYLLILIMTFGDGAITTVKVPDKDSCYRAGYRFVTSSAKINNTSFVCTEIKKESINGTK